LFGGLLPHLFGAMGMTASRAAGAIVEEVRRHLRKLASCRRRQSDYGSRRSPLTKAAIM
jgi:Na+/H+-translocating membrane pyrophosphatase